MVTSTSAIQAARKDFIAFLDEIGTTLTQVQAYRDGLQDVAAMAPEFGNLHARSSAIDGIGLFTARALQRNELVAPARIQGVETLAGRYINHSPHPNARMVAGMDGTPMIVALKSIKGDCEQEITMDYRQARRELGFTKKIGGSADITGHST
ncbi:SET domain-containing protein [Rhodanobacter sp. Si-c]|uniref:SET domain-containing protein n=1 Tax=Rhodanobacter lycopersici TaxID=3162487 RepID=A0ABV3Q9M7_9GAMM